MTGYKERDLASMVSEALKNMPVVVITRMRQAGIPLPEIALD